MTVRFRRSLKIAPGVRINFNTHSTSLSLGPRGAHYTINSNGRRTVSAGIPGTGLYAYETVNPKRPFTSAKVKAEPKDLESFEGPLPKPALHVVKLHSFAESSTDCPTDPQTKANM